MGHNLRLLLPFLVVGGGVSFVGAILYGMWLLGRYHGRDEAMPVELMDVQARLHRLEQAIGQTTNSIDRLEAAHRISARMLSDMPESLERLPGRQVTPH
jgi:hypothetical protein